MELPPHESLIDRQRDALYHYNKESQSNTGNPWLKDPTYFKTCRISSVALLKMTMHARSGGTLEVMGMMQGYIDKTTIVVTDAFRLPVEGTETRVNAAGEADEYLISYLSGCRDESRQENIVGWYHSHPGYGCWLSGIDVETQKLQQMQGPMAAIVVDPDRTVSAGKVEIGAFRTYPDGFMGGLGGGEVDVPMNKAEDFGAHASKYYALEVEHFKSTMDNKLLDLLWNKYWVQTLAQNPLLTNRDFSSAQMSDLGQRVRDAAGAISRSGGGSGGSSKTGGGEGSLPSGLPLANSSAAIGGGRNGSGSGAAASGGSKAASQQSFDRILRDVGQVAAKEKAGLMASEVKQGVFGGFKAPRCGCRPQQQQPEQKEQPATTESQAPQAQPGGAETA